MARPGPLARRIRRFVLGSGPLERGSDAVECVSRVVVLLVVLLSVPVALAVGTVVRSDLAAMARQQAGERTQVAAVVTADAAAPRTRRRGSGSPSRRGGPPPTGPGAGRGPPGRPSRAGDTLTLWVTADGRRADEPVTPAQVRRSTLVLVGLGWAGGTGTAVLLHVALRRLLDRRRDRRWAREWARVEPTWSRRVP